MRYVKPLSESEKTELETMFRDGDSHRVRRRAHIILLSAERFTICELARVYQIDRDTVSSTLTRWEKEGIEGLFDGERSGRPPKLTKEEADEAIKCLKKDPRSIKKALAETKEKTGKEISEWTLKRLAKKAKLRWKRMRKSTKDKRDPVEFERTQAEIEELHEQESTGEIDVYYFDESGFSLTPEVPYAWQEEGETIEIPSQRSKRLNVLGFCNKQLDFHSTTVQGWVDSEVVIDCFDRFCDQINKPTTVLVDNASMHTSAAFSDRLAGWAERGLTVKHLSAYSPELNLIEIIWRFIKYQWLPLSAYSSFTNLKAELQQVLDSIGSEYRITFA